ncbi:metallophosphoesterase [Candidatus Babeliales bacterium]|nr:metallophosphoesterase [Candidatus Babeliales bacterium]
MKKVVISIIFFLCIIAGGYAYFIQESNISEVFSTMTSVEKYAISQSEYPPMDNTRYLKPDYSSFYKRNVYNFWNGLCNKISIALGLKETPLWTPNSFKDLLENLTKDRIDEGYDGEHVLKFVPQVGSKIVLWGDLQGAFHSFTRDLKKLIELGFIDNNLKIIQPNCYFIFNGDLISRSPYIMETLTLAMRIMKKNPKQVFYIKGNHETHDYWQGYGLKTELKLRAKKLSDEKVPLAREINSFFNTLPLALFLGINPNSDTDFVQISHILSDQTEKLNIQNFSGFLSKKEKDNLNILAFKFDSLIPSEKPVELKAIITGQDREFAYEQNKGLLLLPSIHGAIVWTALSCPTLAYQGEFGFRNDAFVTISVDNNPYEWLITLNNQDAKELDGFIKTSYKMLTGEKIDDR